MKKRGLLISILFLFIPFFVYTEQLKLLGNLFMVSVSEEDGRFVVYQRANKQEKWKPLIFEDFPSTTYFRFFAKNLNIIDFGAGGRNNYSEARIVDNSIIYFWQNRELKITLKYTLTSARSGDSSDTLLIDMNILNLNDTDITVNYILCVDSFLGEKSNRHFLLPGDIVINEEKEILKDGIPNYITSYDPSQKIGLNVIFNKENQQSPYRVFFANWKKVEQSSGLYKVESGRNFDLKPYSINDSALFLEFRDVKIASKALASNRFVLSTKNDVNIVNNVKDSDKTTTTQNKESVTTTTTTTTVSTITTTTILQNIDNNNFNNMTISELLALLDKINKKLSSNEKLTDEDIELSKNILDEIKRRKGKK